uniref:Uncharacterized protein n=1 Tax=Podoviridae sp. cthVG1 TaxID=2827297 RepID=A0A8S5RAD1_9CAUD|nr:MAG TPA: hypothetical protein [Podoviridae sp. cthVG1]
MKATAKYNLSKIMKNAWYLKRANVSMTFSACLKKAWRNEKLAVMTAKIEGRNLTEEDAQAKTTTYNPELLTIPADYYGD